MGVVYKARDLKLKREVALKFLPVHLVENTQAKKRFINEAQATAALCHPNIAVVYDFFESDAETVMVMEFLEGETLAQKMKQRAFSTVQKLDWAIGIISGLAAAHKKGITHRDIKPQNIMITPTGMAKILDFGVAKLRGTRTLTETGSRIGTLDYAAPEMVMGSKSDYRSDIFSFGVVLYELLTGQRPFQGEHDAAVVYAIVNETPKPLTHFRKDVSPVLARFVMKMLEKKKESRYQSIDRLLTDLQDFRRNMTRGRPGPDRNGYSENADHKSPDSRLPKEELSKDRQRKGNIFRWKHSYLYAATLIILILVVWIGSQLFTRSNNTIKSIAVLPLENLSGNPEQEYFVSGMTDALITNLAGISALKVISKTSVMHYQDTDKSLPEIAQELKVDAIIEGSVLRAGDEVRITVQLIEAATDRYLWAESYDRNLRNILKLQNELAQAIVRKIQLKLTWQERVRLRSSRSVDPQAYQDYLKGNYFFDKHSEVGFRKSINYFKAAIRKDSAYANAYAGLAESYMGLGAPGVDVLHPGDIMPKAKAAIIKALELDELSAKAHTILGAVRLFYDWDWADAEKEFKRGLELNPNYAYGHLYYALCLSITGRHEQSLETARRALELDLFSTSINVILGNLFFEARQYDQAIKQQLYALEMHPNNWHARWGLGIAYEQKALFDKAITEHEKAVSLSKRNPIVLSSLGHAYALAGRRVVAMKILDELKQLSKQRYVGPFAVAQIYTGLGDKDWAIEWLEKGIQDRSATMIWIGQNPIFDSLRSDSRFTDLLKIMGLDRFSVKITNPE